MALSLLALPAGAAEPMIRFGNLSDRSDVMAVESLRLMGVLVSSSAKGPDGKDAALQLAGSSEPYQLAEEGV